MFVLLWSASIRLTTSLSQLHASIRLNLQGRGNPAMHDIEWRAYKLLHVDGTLFRALRGFFSMRANRKL